MANNESDWWSWSGDTNDKVFVTAFLGLGIALLLAILFLIPSGVREPDFLLSDNTLQIQGLYGVDISYTEIAGVTLADEKMSDISDIRRVNGLSLRGLRRGHFLSSDLGDVILFIHNDSAPTIHIARSDNLDVYISCANRERTEALYNELTEALRNEKSLASSTVKDFLAVNL